MNYCILTNMYFDETKKDVKEVLQNKCFKCQISVTVFF